MGNEIWSSASTTTTASLELPASALPTLVLEMLVAGAASMPLETCRRHANTDINKNMKRAVNRMGAQMYHAPHPSPKFAIGRSGDVDSTQVRHATLIISLTKQRTTKIPVRIAETPAERARGLALVPRVDEGLVFPHFGEMSASYTFASMLVSIDMIAVDTEGRIRFVATNIKPRSPNLTIGGFPISLVAELPAGTVARNDIGPNAMLRSVY